MPVGSVRCIDWDTIEEIGELARAEAIVGEGGPWRRLFDTAALPTYRLLTVEFLSTFRYRRPPAEPVEHDPNFIPDPDVEFRLGGEHYGITIEQFAVWTGLYTWGETEEAMFTDGLTSGDEIMMRVWWETIATSRFTGSTARATALRDPLIIYIHRCIATSISGRGNTQEQVTRPDLFYLHCLITGTPCNLARCLAMYYASYFHRKAHSTLWGGAYITSIIQSRPGALQLLQGLSSVDPSALDRRTILNMRIGRLFPDGVGLRLIDRQGHVFVPPVPVDIQEEQQDEGPGGPQPHLDQGPPSPPQVQQDPPHPPPPPPQDQEPPQFPPLVHRAVRIADPLEDILHRVDREVAAQSTLLAAQSTLLAAQSTRLDDLIQWTVATLTAIARESGVQVQPFPTRRDDPGPSSGAEGGS